MLRGLAFAAALLAAGGFQSEALVSSKGPEVQESNGPLLSIWYRGEPAGVPRAEDLADLGGLGFSAVTWAASSPTEATERLTRLAADAGLRVVIREAPAPIAPDAVLSYIEAADLQPDRLPAGALRPIVWRAIAHGARVVSFDPGRGERLRDLAVRNPPWLAVAGAVGRQLHVNGELLGQSRPGPAVRIEPAVRGLDVALLDAPKAWVVVATNSSDRRANTTARLPPQVPYAMWLDLLDGSTMAMLEQPDGPKWALDIEPGGVRMYVIDKTLK